VDIPIELGYSLIRKYDNNTSLSNIEGLNDNFLKEVEEIVANAVNKSSITISRFADDDRKVSIVTQTSGSGVDCSIESRRKTDHDILKYAMPTN
jgi:hypothetical protein